MMTDPIFEQLRALKLTGMHDALTEQINMDDALRTMSFEERLGLLVDREVTTRPDRQLQYRLRRAGLRQQACVEDIDYRHPRRLDKRLIKTLANGKYLHEHLNVLITGPAGIGKSWLACALANKACRDGYSARYLRLPRLMQELAIARADGRYAKLLREYARADLIILDDWGLAPMNTQSRRDLLEILDDRYNQRSTLVTSQLPVESWHEYIDEPTVADAILDRLIHNAHRIDLMGKSMRHRKASLTEDDTTE